MTNGSSVGLRRKRQLPRQMKIMAESATANKDAVLLHVITSLCSYNERGNSRYTWKRWKICYRMALRGQRILISQWRAQGKLNRISGERTFWFEKTLAQNQYELRVAIWSRQLHDEMLHRFVLPIIFFCEKKLMNLIFTATKLNSWNRPTLMCCNSYLCRPMRMSFSRFRFWIEGNYKCQIFFNFFLCTRFFCHLCYFPSYKCSDSQYKSHASAVSSPPISSQIKNNNGAQWTKSLIWKARWPNGFFEINEL